MKHARKILSVILSVTLFLQFSLPCFADVKNEIQAASSRSPVDDCGFFGAEKHLADSSVPPVPTSPDALLGEDLSRREESSKAYLLDSEHGIAASYANRVHKKAADGSWTDIDNRLVLSDGSYRPKDGAFSLTLPSVLGSSAASLSENGYTVSWAWTEAKAVSAELLDTTNKGLLSNPFYLPNLLSGLLYKDAFANADLRCTVSTVGVKEDIILKDCEAASDYTFTLNAGGMTARQTDARTVSLYDGDTEVYRITAPEMSDASGEISTELSLTLLSSSSSDTLTLRLSASRAWLQDEKRAYPVTLDPYIRTVQSDSTVYDTYITSNHPDTSYGAMGSFYLGKDDFYGISRVLVRFDLPALSKGDTIIDARLVLTQYPAGEALFPAGSAMDIDVYKVTCSWVSTSSTWNNMSSCYDAARLYEYGEATYVTPVQQQEYILTSLVRDWYSGEEPNNGVMLRWREDEGETRLRTHYYSSDYVSLGAYCPVLLIRFLSDVGLEDYRSYHSASAGNAGTAYVNDYSGNLSFAAPVSSTTGLLMPVSTGLFYNGYLSGRVSQDNKYGLTAGKGWTFSLSERIDSLNGGWTNSTEQALFNAMRNGPGTFRYVFRDADATVHYLYQDGSVYKDEEGLSLELSINASSTSERYCLSYKDGSRKLFDSAGYLTKVCDANGNCMTLSYTTGGSRKFLTSVTDGANRTTTISRDSNNRITSVTAPGSRTTTLTYNASGLLTELTYPDGLHSYFTYDSENRLTQVRNLDQSKLVFSYRAQTDITESEKNKVIEIREYGTNSVSGNYVKFSYGDDNTTRFTYSVNGNELSEISTFDYYGRTVSCTDLTTGAATDFSYTSPSSPNGSTNKLSSASSKGETIHNLIVNGSFERAGEGWTGISPGISPGISLDTDGYVGSYSASLRSAALLQSVSGLEAGSMYTLSLYLKGSGAVLLTDDTTYADRIVQVTDDGKWHPAT